MKKELTEEELNTFLEQNIVKSKEYFYVKVDASFTMIRRVEFSDIVPEFYGCGRFEFNILSGFNEDSKYGNKARFHTFDIEKNFYVSFDEAVKSLRNNLETTLSYDYDNMATRGFVGDEVNRRFGESLENYFLSASPEKK